MRPYGVGCLVAGVDENGSYIYETSPDANTLERAARLRRLTWKSTSPLETVPLTSFSHMRWLLCGRAIRFEAVSVAVVCRGHSFNCFGKT